MDSIDAKINQLISSWDNLVNNFNQSGNFKTIVKLLTGLVDVLDLLINKTPIAGTLFGVVLTSQFLKLGKNLKVIGKEFSDVYNFVQQFNKIGANEVLSAVQKNLTDGIDIQSESIQNIINVSKNWDKWQKILAVSQMKLDKNSQILMLRIMGVSEQEAIAAANGYLLKLAQDSATVSTNMLTRAQLTLSTAFKTNPIGTALTAIYIGYTLVTSVMGKFNQVKQESIDKSKELHDNLTAENSKISENISTIEGLQSEYDELSRGVDSYGNNVSLTADEYERYNEIIDEVLKLSPDLADSYKNQNSLLSDQVGLLDEAISKEKERAEVANRASTTGKQAEDLYSGAFESYQDIYKDNELYIGGSKSATKIIDNISTSKSTRKNFAEALLKGIGLDEESINKEIEQHSQNGIVKLNELIRDNYSDIIDNVDNITNYIEQNPIPGVDIDNLSKDLEDLSQNFDSAKNSVSSAEQVILDDLALTAQGLKDFSKLSSDGMSIIEDFIVNPDNIDKISYTDIFGNLVYDQKAYNELRTIGESYVQALLAPIDESGKLVQDSINDILSIDLGSLTVNEYTTQVESMIKNIRDSVKGILGKEETEKFIIDIETKIGYNEEELNRIKDTVQSKFDELEIDLNTEDLTIDQLKYAYKNIDTLKESMDAYESVTGDAVDTSEEFKAMLDLLASSTTDAKEAVSSYVDNLSGMESAFETLGSAINEYNSNGFNTIDTISKLIELDDKYLALLTLENGQLVLNTEASKNMIKAELQEAIASAKQAQAKLVLEAAVRAAQYSTDDYKESLDDAGGAVGTLASKLPTLTQRLYDQAKASLAVTAAEHSGDPNFDAYMQDINDRINANQALIDSLEGSYNNVDSLFNNMVSSSTSAASDSSDAWKEEFEALYRDLQHQREMDLISEEQYFNELNKLNQKYFANRKEYLEDYYKYEEEVYQGLKQLAEDRLEAEGNAAINEIDERIDALEKEKEALDEKYEAEEDELKLQKAKDRYEAAKGQLVNRVYTSEKGWTWQADQEEVDEAKEELEEIEREIAKKEQEKLIDDQIEALEDLKEEYQKAMDKIGNSLEENQQDLEFTKEFQNMTLEEMQDAVADYASRVEEEAARVEEAYARMRAAAAAASVSGGGGGSSGGSKKPSSGSSSSSSTSKPNSSNSIKDTASNIMSGAGNGFLQGGIGGAIGGAISGALKGSRAGGIEMGAVDFTGPLMVHGTPENPEYVLTSRQMENLVKNMSRTIPEGRLNSESKSEDIVFTNCKFELPNVKEPNNFIPSLKQLAKQNRK